ncbi:MAG: LPS export ABC transporter permease LptF [Novosphingobium sp. 17-62-19]|uniref:LPS export ABC transporter permease LptF n=1 Tax=Novosphingobium sp. 17-62-19 TaxID=1970406 RepID=UPI000BD88FFB|nr:LPS export ABC transporter permease LptF [Novosphingobium sp. 17-62-19]OYX93334.1 MAG: LPS export ABC transporter permease LptF [Novosphingobium sp. 35-62-5]OZA18998.1 MAG: LPS export ABC transporter permease LptF [Novosphingobium sp. 17-62-19]HQS97784.1 LPS export ABC transporter permease LptF [Novosphingobium sp.]
MKFFTAIDRYIARLVFVPMLSVFVLAASLLVLDKMLKLFDFVATEGGPISVVFKMLANLLPEYASLAIPLGLMLGILFAFRKLATSSELDVMRAVGLSYTRLLRVPYMFAIGLAALNLVIVSYLQPLSRYYYEELQFELRSGALGASIKVGEFNSLQDRTALRVDSSRDEGRDLRGIFARLQTESGQVMVISAREGRFFANRESPDTVILRLTDGQIVQDGPDIASPRVLTFASHDLPIDLPKIEEFRQRGDADNEYFLPELLQIGWSDRYSEELRIQSQANFNYRIVEVVMMFLLPLLALALAVPPKRSTSALGVFLSIVMVVAYHKVNQYGQDVASLGRIDPVLALWGPFVLFAALILWMYWRIAYVPGGQPIGALETLFGKIGRMVRKLFERKRLPDEAPPQDEAPAHAA